MFRTVALAAMVACGVAGAAQARTLVDFTDRTQWTGNQTSRAYPGFTVTLATLPVGTLPNFNQNFDGGASGRALCAANGLACVSDGLGISDDEITAPRESVTLTFVNAVNVTRLFFLDLFRAASGSSLESAIVTVNGSASYSFSADLAYRTSGGFLASLVNWTNVTTLRFEADLSNDAVGAADFSLAGLEVSPVPLPAPALLLIGGLAVFGVAARRRSA